MDVHVGVASNDPDSLTFVVGTNLGSSDNTPLRVIPHRGKVCKNSSESPSSEHWAVFHPCESGSNFANDAGHVAPHRRPGPVDSSASTGCADVLARETARYHVNKSAPRSAVKGLNVIPNRERRENAVILSLDKNACGVGSPFNSADCAPSEQVASENSSTSAREKSQLIHDLLSAHRCGRFWAARPDGKTGANYSHRPRL